MSDLQVYELEDIVWDDFAESDDHIVPHPGGEHGNECPVRGDNCKRPRCEVIGVNNNADDRNATKYFRQGKEETNLPTLKHKRDKMLEKGSWSCTPDGVFPASCDSDSIKETTTLSSDDTMMSTRCFKSSNIESIDNEFCANDPILGDRCVAVDNNLYRYPLSHISQADNDLSFFDNARDEKECSDLLYCGWPDIGNFEDVDRMFRSCDSTFGLGSASNEEELSWFSSSHTNEESEDAMKLGFKFPPPESSVLKSASEQNEASRPNDASPSISESIKKNVSIGYKPSPQISESNKPDVLSHLSFMDGSETVTESKDDFTSKEHVYLHKKQSKHQNLSEGKRKDRFTENGGGFHHFPNPKQFADVKLPFGDSSCQVLATSGIRRQEQSVGSDSLCYSHIPYTHSNYIHPSDQFPVSPTPSCVKSENNGHSPFSPKESSYASNIQSMESSHDASFETPAIKVDEKREKLYRKQGFQTSFAISSKHKDLVVQAACYDPISVQKQLNHSENEVEGHSEVEGGSISIPMEMDSSNVQDNSCMSSMLEEISLEATSFRQLQNVTEQLDIRTKLCIRDSLYRLARSAEQRHNCGSLNSSSRDDGDTGGLLMAAEPNKCTGFMDMETDTNPIDRSIAHLLFHRPSDPSIVPNDALSLKSQNMMQGSITSSPVVAEKLVSLEENAAGSDKNVADLDKK